MIAFIIAYRYPAICELCTNCYFPLLQQTPDQQAIAAAAFQAIHHSAEQFHSPLGIHWGSVPLVIVLIQIAKRH